MLLIANSVVGKLALVFGVNFIIELSLFDRFFQEFIKFQNHKFANLLIQNVQLDTFKKFSAAKKIRERKRKQNKKRKKKKNTVFFSSSDTNKTPNCGAKDTLNII